MSGTGCTTVDKESPSAKRKGRKCEEVASTSFLIIRRLLGTVLYWPLMPTKGEHM